MSSSPCAYTLLDGKRLKVSGARLGGAASGAAGTVGDRARFAVVRGDGQCVELCDIQLEGAKRMPLEVFLRGKKLEKGAVLG